MLFKVHLKSDEICISKQRWCQPIKWRYHMTRKAEVQRSIPVYINMKKNLKFTSLNGKEDVWSKGVNSLKNLGKHFDLLLRMNIVWGTVRIDKASFTQVFLDKIKGEKIAFWVLRPRGKKNFPVNATNKNLSRKTVDYINEALQQSVMRTHKTWVQIRENSYKLSCLKLS